MKRNVPPLGQCGIASLAQFPIVPKGTPLPVPPPTKNSTRPTLPCNCQTSCVHTCKAVGMTCCDGTGGNCNCAPASSCPKCQDKVLPYGQCVASCAPNKVDVGCTSTTGMPGSICAPRCTGPAWGTSSSCPPTPKLPGVTAVGVCDYCFGAVSVPHPPDQYNERLIIRRGCSCGTHANPSNRPI
jgi:hypothetical protein